MALTFSDYLQLPSSKKITLLELDSPLTVIWLNYSPGRWFALLTPGKKTDVDDQGNVAYWGSQNEEYLNIGSLSVMGEQYAEAGNFAAWEIAAPKTWFYDTVTSIIYLTIDGFDPPEAQLIIKPGAIIGISNQEDIPANNIYGGIWYRALLKSIPSLTKQKDPLFFGIIQYSGGTADLDNAGGDFDDLADRGLYGQPLRVRLTFEGLPYDESLVIYTARVGKFVHTWDRLQINIADVRSFLTRKLPINTFSKSDSGSSFYFPDIDDKLDGIPVPVTFGPSTQAPAYKTSSGNWTFADTTLNAIDALSVGDVIKEDGTTFTFGGTGTNGTFTGTDTDDKLFVTFTQSVVDNGLDVISFILENYENIPFDTLRYDLTEWNAEKPNVKDMGIWLGQGRLFNSIDIITKVCQDNQGIFDVLADGRFTFRTLDPDKDPVAEIQLDEILDIPKRVDDPTEVLSRVIIEYSENLKDELHQIYTNIEFQESVYSKFENYPEKVFTTNIINETDAVSLSDDVMSLSKDIFPSINLNTKTQYIELRLLDLILYTYARIDGKILIPRSRYQVLLLSFDLMDFEISIGIKQIREDDGEYSF